MLRISNVTDGIDIDVMAAVMKKLRVCRRAMALKFPKAAALDGSGRVKGRFTNLRCRWFRYRRTLKETNRRIQRQATKRQAVASL